MTIDDATASQVAAFAVERGARATIDAGFGERTTYRVGGRARVLIEARDPSIVAGIGEVIGDDVGVLVVGNGSNLLVSDNGFDGVVVACGLNVTSSNDGIEVHDLADDWGEVAAMAHVRLPVLARQTVASGWCGLEWAVGVPGSVGGGVRMNAGGHGSDVAASLVHVDLVNVRTGRSGRVARDDLGLRFRGSALTDDVAVVSASFRVRRPRNHDCAEELSSIVAWRREHQPGGQNAGSVFVNPGDGQRSAGALIDAVGLRGHRIGSAEVSMKHANFIQADQDGRAADVVDLMVHVQECVRASTGITMRSEVRLVGFPDHIEGLFVDPGRNDDEVVAAEQRLKTLV